MDKREEQRRDVRNALQFLLGWAVIIALLAGGYFLVGRLPRSVAPGPDVTVFIERGIVNDNLFWVILVGTMFFFLLLGAVKTNFGVAMICAAYLAGGGALLWGLYGRVAAIAFSGNTIELRYVWPRPAERLDPGEIVSARYEQSARTYDDYAGPLDYQLLLSTRRGDRESFYDPQLSDMQRVLRRIDELQGRSPTPPRSPARSRPSPAR